MEKYELTIVLPEKFTPAKIKAQKETIEKMVKVFKGKILKTDDWGVTPLAYEIKKNTSGIFILFQLELEGASVNQLREKLRMEENLLRYLLIRV